MSCHSELSEESARQSSALTAGDFFLRRQEKVTKKKATPGSAVGAVLPSVGSADFPALLVKPGGCATRACGPQTVLADFPRLACVARRSTGGAASERNRPAVKGASVLVLPSALSSSAEHPAQRARLLLGKTRRSTSPSGRNPAIAHLKTPPITLASEPERDPQPVVACFDFGEARCEFGPRQAEVGAGQLG